jgi:hypothetical protein
VCGMLSNRGQAKAWGDLPMGVRVVDGEALGCGGGVEFQVGGEHDHRAEPRRLIEAMDFHHRGKLHGVIRPQTMFACHKHGIAQERRC